MGGTGCRFEGVTVRADRREVGGDAAIAASAARSIAGEPRSHIKKAGADPMGAGLPETAISASPTSLEACRPT